MQNEKSQVMQVDIYEVLLDTLCCVMCADRKITTREREAVHRLLQETKAPWDRDEVNNRINTFVRRVKNVGLNRIVQETCVKLGEFKRLGKKQVLLRCIDVVIRADEIVDKNEMQLYFLFRSALETKKDGEQEHKGIKLIYQNPFRILGLPVTATEREIVKCISDLSIFMEMGKTKEFDCDHFFPVKPHRTSESIADASQNIEQPNNKLFYALFWFWENPTNAIDQMAFEELKNGNVEKAIQFWEKATDNAITTKNSSNHKNLAVLYLGLSCENDKLDRTMFLKSLGLSSKFLANGHFETFIKHVIGPKHSINRLEVINSYVDEIISLVKPYLDKPDCLKTKELIKNLSSYPSEIQNAILDKLIGKYIHNIERQIEIAHTICQENVSAANEAGFELIKKTEEDLKRLRSILSESDLEFQLIADKLAEEIISCSICYFNKFRDSETDPGDDALKLAKCAKQIAVGEKINEKIDEGIPILTEYVNEKPKREKLKSVKEEVEYIYKRINVLQTMNRTLSGPSILSSLSIDTSSVYRIGTFVDDCMTRLNQIRDKLGKEDADYVQLCDLVANVAMGICVAALNAVSGLPQALLGLHRASLQGILTETKRIFEKIGRLHMSHSTRSNYSRLCTQIGLNPTPSSGSGCYVATMIYGSYNAPEVMVLRTFRDEVLQQSWIGRKCVNIYYKFSPLIVKKTKHVRIIHVICKSMLDLFVEYLKGKDE